MKALCVDLPYPKIDDFAKDKESAYLLFSAYAGCHSELNAILQYIYHHYYFALNNKEDISELLLGISLCEMHHLDILGELILQLGLEPLYIDRQNCLNPYYSSSYVSYSNTAKKMLLDDITGEMTAVSDYQNLIYKLKNQDVSAVISRIVLDEELHIKLLKKALEEV